MNNKVISKFIKVTSVAIMGFSIFSLPAMSYSPFLDQSYEMYSTRNRCEMCHSGAKLNQFGEDFSIEWKKSKDIVKAYLAVEDKDSDGDGYSNVSEINAISLPGDKTSIPVKTTISKIEYQMDLFRNN